MPRYTGIIRLEGGFNDVDADSPEGAEELVRANLWLLCNELNANLRWGGYGWQPGDVSTTESQENARYILVKTKSANDGHPISETVDTADQIDQLVDTWLDWQAEQPTEETYDIVDTTTERVVMRILPED